MMDSILQGNQQMQANVPLVKKKDASIVLKKMFVLNVSKKVIFFSIRNVSFLAQLSIKILQLSIYQFMTIPHQKEEKDVSRVAKNKDL